MHCSQAQGLHWWAQSVRPILARWSLARATWVPAATLAGFSHLHHKLNSSGHSSSANMGQWSQDRYGSSVQDRDDHSPGQECDGSGKDDSKPPYSYAQLIVRVPTHSQFHSSQNKRKLISQTLPTGNLYGFRHTIDPIEHLLVHHQELLLLQDGRQGWASKFNQIINSTRINY